MNKTSPRKQLFKLLFKILAISAIAHVALLIIFGSYTVFRYVISTGSDFEEPPPTVQEVPPPTNVEVTIQKPRSTEPPSRDLKVQTVGNIAVPAVASNIAGLQESFVVGGGMGGGGMGSLRLSTGGGLGLGVSEISVFGVRDKGERILFVVDTGRNMLLDSKGGLYSYNAIKEELIRLIRLLSPGTLFNVILFEGTRTQSVAFRPSMAAATPENFDALSRWFMPINQNAKDLGLSGGSLQVARAFTDHPVGVTFAANGVDSVRRWPPRLWISHNALEQDADLIYVITANWGGFIDMERHITEREREQIAADRARLEATSAFQSALASYMQEKARLIEVIRERELAEMAERQQRNLPPRIWIHDRYDHRWGFNERRNAYGIQLQNRDPRPVELFWPHHAPKYRHDARSVEDYFRNYMRVFYRDKNKPVPRMNVIMFLAEDEDFSRSNIDDIRNFLRNFNNGRFRELRGLAAIQRTAGS